MSELNAEASRIYRKHGLAPRAGRTALAKKLGIQMGGNYALNQELRTRLSGQSIRQSATEMGLSDRAVRGRANTICRKEHVHGRKELLEKMRQPTPPEPAAITK